MDIKQGLLDELLQNYQKPEDLLSQEGILKQLTKALIERALEGELRECSTNHTRHVWACRASQEIFLIS